ncbi:UPF0323 family lipoprotein [Aliarcobacter cryaerophilus]|uniref:UPF0323 domain-containing protein n=1 Tax=Aliarcobacter cryaerophilus TaxID=28198 RepID=A0A2S9TMR0_9BACT|nr:UPF0323 family lipoprotein [Aliarcobacter cryaerophilus]MCT7404918.1 UPF0323 family lipoprotein [Aliarcobacter cryaerophilus]MCT7493847.1 UPF0323 family lipoprotein [Aliarcobacter cryaerophilus]MCT7502664.1 UPF0323 family lipoprotein [Aliarcobacter cryaerophilus]PRN00124.1 hypothetical protein CJ668_07660 [Arcobacter cryaerophilus gv. pseudocryaerophilus]QNM89380.1 hypothetical protein HOO34_06795 [Aliarcobacter cryaerophilus]
MQNKNIKTLKELAKKGGLATFLILGLNACNDNSNQNNQSNGTFTNASQQEGAFVIVEKALDGSYKIADEFPAAKTTIVLRNPDGTERILSQEEIDKLVKEEEAKIDAGTSPLTNPEMSSGGMGLGGVLLSSIAGAMIGSWLGNKLFNNQNFQNQKAAQYKSPQTYSKSQSSFNKPSSTAGAGKQSGFFGGNNQNSSQNNNSTKSTTQSTGG